jgi:ABC-2 type transport system ATP-binding protein
VEEVLGVVGLDRVARQRAGKFSLGMAQRLGIAAALLGDPGVLLLDEPVNGLDPEGIRWIRNLLKSLAAGVLSVTLFAGLGTGMAARAAAARDGGSAAAGDSSTTATTSSPATSDDSGSASRSWSAAPSPGQDQSAATTSAGS